MLSEQFDSTPQPKKVSTPEERRSWTHLERAQHHENEASEWRKFIHENEDSLTFSEQRSAWATMSRHDMYAENNRKRANNPFYEPPKRCKTCDQPLGR